MNMGFQDSHCHLYMLPERELEKALKDAKEKRVEKMVSCSTSFKSNEDNIYLSEKYPKIRAALGLYPLDALELSNEELERAFSFIRKQSRREEVVAIGEVGLDHKFAKSDEEKERQEFVFRRFISLAKEIEKPLIVHSRYAQSRALRVLEEEKAEKVLMHSFIDSSKLMGRAAELGYFVSVGMIVLENCDVQKRIGEFPTESLLFETDSPIRFAGERAMPKDIARIASKVAELKGVGPEKVGAALEKNFERLFG